MIGPLSWVETQGCNDASQLLQPCSFFQQSHLSSQFHYKPLDNYRTTHFFPTPFRHTPYTGKSAIGSQSGSTVYTTGMADSDGEYVELSSDDELHPVVSAQAQVESSYGTRSKGEAPSGRDRTKGPRGKGNKRAAWEDIQRSWEDVVRDEEGGKISYTIDQLIDEEKRRGLLRGTTPLQRGIIRHLMLVIDMSFAMEDKDMLPTRYYLTLNYAVEFVREYFEQNPISQLGIVGMKDGVAVRISDMSGNAAEHIERLRYWHDVQTPSGDPSLQNALEMCRGALLYVYHTFTDSSLCFPANKLSVL